MHASQVRYFNRVQEARGEKKKAAELVEQQQQQQQEEEEEEAERELEQQQQGLQQEQQWRMQQQRPASVDQYPSTRVAAEQQQITWERHNSFQGTHHQAGRKLPVVGKVKVVIDTLLAHGMEFVQHANKRPPRNPWEKAAPQNPIGEMKP